MAASAIPERSLLELHKQHNTYLYANVMTIFREKVPASHADSERQKNRAERFDSGSAREANLTALYLARDTTRRWKRLATVDAYLKPQAVSVHGAGHGEDAGDSGATGSMVASAVDM